MTGRCGDIDLPALTEQARHFLSLYGKTLNFESIGNKYRDAVILMDRVNEQVKDFTVELVDIGDREEEHRELVAYNVMENFDTSVIYFMPVKILECVDAELREVLLDFFAFLLYYGMFITPKSSYEMCFAMNWDDCSDQYDEYADPTSEYKEKTDRYLLGDINAVFEEMEKRVKQQAGCQRVLADNVRRGMYEYRNSGHEFYTLPNGVERLVSELFEVLEEGLELHMEDSLSNYDIIPIRNHLGDDYFCEEYGGSDDMIWLGSIFLFSYGMDDDDVVKETIDVFNNNDSSMNYPVLVEVARVGKCSGRIEKSDYPERWEAWYKKIMEFIYE